MEEILHIIEQIWDLLNEMSPYLLLGFLLAGLMHAFVPGSLYSRFLAKGNFRSVLYAALFGIPLPLCSCGVIPTAMSLRKEGASKGAAVSFLIATPQTGVDSIIATFSLMGLPFAILRPIAALLTAVFGGQMVNVANRKEEQPATMSDVVVEDACEHSHCHTNAEEQKGFGAKLKEALEYAFLEMMEDIGKWLVVGLVVAGLITILVPDSFFAVFQGNTLLSMLLVLCIAVPMYICATGSIPIAVALMMKGLTPGSALVLLMAGPACNVASILVINKVLGRRTLLTYLASIILGSIIFGVVIDQCLPSEWFVPSLMPSEACCEHGASWWSITSTVILLALLLHAMWNHYFGHSQCHCHDGECSCEDHCHEEECSCGEHSHEEACEGAQCHEEHCSELNDGVAPDAASPTSSKLAFSIKGMNCSHCRANALRVLEEIPGVTKAEVDLASGRASVVGETTLKEVSEALATLGFELKE